MQSLKTTRLVLDPLVAGHAPAMFRVLQDPSIYQYLDYPPPPTAQHLQSAYEKLESRRSADGTEEWLNWAIFISGGEPIGYVQATVRADTAWVAYVLSSRFWGHGYATEATRAMIEHLSNVYGVRRFRAIVEADNQRSIALLTGLGFERSPDAERDASGLTPTEHLFVREEKL